MITEDYCSYEVAKLLKDKGFNEDIHTVYEPTFNKFFNYPLKPNSYSNVIAAPTHQMAMKWLREKHRLHIDIDPSEGNWNPTVITLEDWSCVVKFGDNILIQDTYEEAVEAALKYVLENLI